MKAYNALLATAILFLFSCKNNPGGQPENDTNPATSLQGAGSAGPGAPATAGAIQRPFTPDEGSLVKNATSSQALSVNETKGISHIKSYYGCECKSAVGESKSQGKVKKFFQLEASNGAMLDSTRPIAELTVSNIAMLFYQNLAEDRSKYDEIISSVVFSDGQKAVKTYPMATLALVFKKTATLGAIVDCLKAKNYDKLASLLNDKNGILQYDKQKLMEQIKRAEPELGNVKDFVPYGFIFIKSEDNRDILHISGLLVRDKQNNEFSVDFDPASGKNEAMFLNYKL